MKKLAIVVLLVVAGCRRQAAVGSPSSPNTPGGASPREAVQRFMAAAKAQDLQALSIVWGTPAGPAREHMDKNELEQREIIMMCYLKHDSYQVLSESPAANGERLLMVESRYKDLTRSASFNAVPGPQSRWFVRGFDMEKLRDICAKR